MKNPPPAWLETVIQFEFTKQNRIAGIARRSAKSNPHNGCSAAITAISEKKSSAH
jgi:hypothetical protein